MVWQGKRRGRLSEAEIALVLDWYYQAADNQAVEDEDIELADRLRDVTKPVS